MKRFTANTPQPVRLKDSVEKVEKILEGDNKCSKFLGKNAEAALEALAKLWQFKSEDISTNKGIQQDFAQGAVVPGPDGNPIYRIPGGAIVYRNGPLFMGTSGPGIGGYDRGSEGALRVALLHEIAHEIITGRDAKGNLSYLIPNDGPTDDPTGKQNKKNTQTILDNCKNEVFNAIK